MSDKINYTADEIRRYLEGEMSPAEMYALERAALTDPFLADALEGMELHADIDKFAADVEDLRTRLKGKVKRRTGALASVNSLWWKIAAVLVILVTGVAIIIITGKKNEPASNEIAKTEDRIINKDSEVKKEQTVIQPQAVEGESKKQVRQPAITIKPKKEQKPARAAEAQEEVLYNKAETDKIEKPAENNINRELAASSIPSAIAAPASDSLTKESDTMFDEVIVVGSGRTNKKNVKSRTISAGRAEKTVTPGNGWDEFQRYVEDSTNISTTDSVFTGEEHLSFTIGDDGLPESIKILRSISPSHDKEAIRLLQNGPSWKVAKGRKREVRLKIIF